MAIVVPLLIANTAVGASMAAAVGMGVSTFSAVVGVAFQVTGINDKINKAASKVFGKDLVNVANIAGVVYGAVNGGFEIGGAADTATAGASLSKAALDGTSAFGANSVDGAFDIGAAAVDSTPIGGEIASKASLDGTDAFGFNSAPNSFNLSDMADAAPAADVTQTTGKSMLSENPIGTDSKMAEQVSRQQGATASGASALDAASNVSSQSVEQIASGQNAAAARAAGALSKSQLDGTNAFGANSAPGAFNMSSSSGNVFSRMFGNLSEKERLGLLQGAGSALSSAMASKDAAKQRQAEMDWQKERYYNNAPSVRVVG